MISVTQASDSNSNPTPKSKNAYHVGGIKVEFPYQPYGTQLAYMGRVISTLDRAQRDGHCHALLESPTGTGKSLSLLCSTLAWQQNYKFKYQYANLTQSKPNPEAMTDPLGHGGGFIPETQPLSIPIPSGNVEPPQPAGANKGPKKNAAPTIFYSSRTHSQISQVIREYKKTAYRVPMAVLASRKHYCTNNQVNGKENLDEECKLLLKDPNNGCLQFKNAVKVRTHPLLQRGGCHEVHDIEDIVKIGKQVRGCSYYAARAMADDAQLIFCPYNYLINPIIRGAMDINIKGGILIFDEAHNIEDVARDAGSVDVDEDVLIRLQTELEQICKLDPSIYEPLYDMVQDLVGWIEQKKRTFQKREFQNYFSCWTSEKALYELQEANISQRCFPILLDCATKAIKAATDPDLDTAHLSGMSVIVLEGLFSSLTYFFSRNGSHISDYQLALRRYVKRGTQNSVGEWTCTLSLWCLNPAVVFRDIANISLSIILTSGTLSPLSSFSSELGIPFGTCLEAPHVIDTESQVWAAVLSTGPDNYPLNASYKTADEYDFQDSLGKTLEEICMVVPGGSLVFFPSYKLMEKLCSRWHETGQWSRINARKSVFVEPRGGSHEEDFDSALKGYYDSIHQCSTHAVGKKRRTKKAGLRDFIATKPIETSEREGAAFLAVCRGKVSEGIDFSDDNARVVIVVGIPFPNMYDIQVGLKKSYNDTYKTTKNLINGNDWYCQQAFRALNQAIGRCIRHRFDYGAIILLDERYKREQNRIHISKWLRNSVRQYESYSKSMEDLKHFFGHAKENICKKMADILPNSEPKEVKNLNPGDQMKGCTKNKNQKLNKPDLCGEKLVSLTKCDSLSPKLESQTDVKEQKAKQTSDDNESHREIIDLECDFQKDSSSRCSEVSCQEDPEVTFVKETPGTGPTGCNGTIRTTVSWSKNWNSNLNLSLASAELTEQMSSHSACLTNASRAQCPEVGTPGKDSTAITPSMTPEAESTFNLSVNSHTQKKRKSLAFPLIDLIAKLGDCTPGSVSYEETTIAIKDATRRIEFDVATNCAEPLPIKLTAPHVLPADNSAPSSDPFTDQKLLISCAFCKNPLGRPENQFYVRSSLTSSSKVHLRSLVKERLEHCNENTSMCIPVLMTDITSIDQRLCNSNLECEPGQGVWCEEDGCVFKSLCCPFCSISNLLGVQIMATDASNIQLLNKILFYFDRLEIQSLERPVDKTQKVLQNHSPSMDKNAAFNAIDRFSYSPQQNSGGWRTTKPKLRLPKKSQILDGSRY